MIVRPLGAEDAGFGLHAATRAGAHDARAREALLKYILPPPVASEHLTFTTDGLVRIALKRPFRDGTIAVDLDPCRSFVASPPPCPSPGNTRSSPRSGRCSPPRSRDRASPSLAEHGQLPRQFAATHPRFRTPHVAIIVVAAGMRVVTLTGSFVYAVTINSMIRADRLLVHDARADRSWTASECAGGRLPSPAGDFVAAAALILCLLVLLPQHIPRGARAGDRDGGRPGDLRGADHR